MKMRCFVLLLYCLNSVYSDIQYSHYKQLQSLREITEQIDREGIYPIRTPDFLRVDEDDLSFVFSTRSDINGTRISFSNISRLTELTTFNTSLRTVIYIHGWLDGIEDSASKIKDSLLNASDLNVVILDWDECANSIHYLVSWTCVEGTGNQVGKFLSNVSETYNYTLDRITLVGHSLGAHIAGYAGQWNHGSLGAIVGLDPAKPFFFKGQINHRLDKTDAKYVEVIHTSNFVGIDYESGHVDFWPNGGHHQVGCGLDLFGGCAHVRAPLYYAESVQMNDFGARQCDSYKHFQRGKCSNNSIAMMGGLELDNTIQGVYYLETNEHAPYGKGKL